MFIVMQWKERVQAAALKRGGDESLYGRYFARHFSYVISGWLVAHTKVTANQVTLASAAAGIVGWVLLSTASPYLSVIGVVLLHVWLVLDAVDGEVARGRNSCSAVGVYFDKLGHFIVNPYVVPAYSFHLFRKSGNLLFAYAAALIAVIWVARLGSHVLVANRATGENPGVLARIAQAFLDIGVVVSAITVLLPLSSHVFLGLGFVAIEGLLSLAAFLYSVRSAVRVQSKGTNAL
jgi:phosphatidylglycerophosphate synthase